MINKFLPKAVFFFTCLFSFNSVYAQTLEEVDMSIPAYTFNTYLTDINNKGLVTGYYVNAAGNNTAFVITAHGKEIVISIPSFTDTKAQSINDNGVALINASNGAGNITPYRVYIDTLGDSVRSKVAVTSMQQPSGIPYKINIKNDISGYYQGATEKWLFVDHDSIPLNAYTWNADEYTDGYPNYDFFNTYIGGANDNNIAGGFYINGATYNPFTYDVAAQTFSLITGAPAKTKIWDINNSGVVCGEYAQANGFYMGFWGTISANMLTMHSLTSIFQNATIQSVVNGINENGDMVGSFLHPTTNSWVGFIYKPNTTEYRMPGFNFTHDTWSMKNDQNLATGVFTPNYYGNYNYNTMDPYANNGTPLFDHNIRVQYGIHGQVANGISPDWVSYAQEVDRYNTVAIPAAYTIAKSLFMSNYLALQANGFNGYCYGFSYTALLHHFNDALFSSWFNIPVNTNIYQIGNSDTNAIRAISRMYIKQNDVATLQKYNTDLYANVQLWEGMYNLKTNYMLPQAQCNPRTVSINYNNNYRHNIMPYKIHTPKMLPFDYPAGTMLYDTLFTYDSNFPQDSTKYFLINSTKYAISHDSVHHSTTGYNPIHYISFNKASINETMNVPHAYLKGTSANTYYSNLTFTVGSNAYYSIKDPAANLTDYNASGYSSNSLVVTATSEDANNTVIPHTFILDTNLTVSYNSSNYVDSEMRWSQVNNTRAMGITRDALPSERDNATLKSRVISYGNPDATTKHFAGYLSQLADDMSQGTNILASNVTAQQGDSFLTENPSEYVYKITRIAGTGTDTYDLTVDVVSNGTLTEFSTTGISLTGNTSHTIDPYYPGPNGPTVVVFVDQGMTGTYSDTLFVPQGAVNINKAIHAADYISVYPNPVSKYANVTLSAGYKGSFNVILTDIAGHVLYRQTMTDKTPLIQLPMAAYSTGVYMLTVTDPKGQILYRDKLMKE